MAKRYIDNHESEKRSFDIKKTYYRIMEDKLSTLEPILNKIKDQVNSEKVRLVVK
jgi:hypothetical protein